MRADGTGVKMAVLRQSRRIARAVRQAPPRVGQLRTVLIDGPSGAGKTTLAAALARRLGGAPVVHMDDLYAGWAGLEGAFARLRDTVLTPLRDTGQATYQVYDWHAQRFGPTRTVCPGGFLIIEGCGCARREAQQFASLIVWLEADPALAIRRAARRDGRKELAHLRQWRADQDAHFARNDTRARADIRLEMPPAGPALTPSTGHYSRV